jgi:dipeptidyl aminopeptidase/acylaminoacyl peptidase
MSWTQIPVARAALLLLLTLSATQVGAQNADDLRWTPEKSMDFDVVQQTAISPDGARVAYVVRVPLIEGEQSEYLSHIWLVDADGTNGVQFTRGEKSATSPAFSPDGRWLAFTTSREGDGDAGDDEGPQTQVWVIGLAGGEAFPVTEAETGVASYRWSPSGDRIAYVSRDPETEDEKARKREKRDPIFVDQNFKYNHIYSVSFDPSRSDPGEATRHTEGDFHVTSFDWAPDGRTLAFSHQADPRLDEGARASAISTVPADGSNRVAALVDLGGTDTGPRYSPDGSTVAFVSSGETAARVGLGDIYVVSASGGEPRKLSDSHDRSGGLQGWSRDGRSVLLLESVGTTRHLTSLPVDGGPLMQLTDGAGVIGAPSFADDVDVMAFSWQTVDTPNDVHVSPVGSFTPSALTDLHASIEMPALGKTELLTWRSEDGRFDIEGLLTYPVDYDPSRSYPLILNVHGGPAGVFAQSFTGGAALYNIQYFAQEGYAVLRPNPRSVTWTTSWPVSTRPSTWASHTPTRSS